MEGESGATGLPCRPSSPSIQFFLNGVRQCMSFPFEMAAVIYGIERSVRPIIGTPRICSSKGGAAVASSLPDWCLLDRRSPHIGVDAISERRIRRGHGHGVNKTFKSIGFSHTCEVLYSCFIPPFGCVIPLIFLMRRILTGKIQVVNTKIIPYICL